MDVNNAINDLVNKADELKDFEPLKVTLLEEAVKLADSVNDTNQGYYLRNQLMDTASYCGREDLVIVAFSWCLAEFDKNPEEYDIFEILWRYKWVFGDAQQFPTIPLKKLNELKQDLEMRFKKDGSTMHAVYSLHRDFYLKLGDFDKAKEANLKYEQTRRDALSDCAACVSYRDMEYYRNLGQWKKALQTAKPVLEKKLVCAEQPHVMYSGVLLPLFMLKKYGEADDYQAKGIRMISRHRHLISSFANQIIYLTMRGNLAKAKTIIEKYFPKDNVFVALDEKFDFCMAVKLFCARNIQKGTNSMKMRLPLWASGNVDQVKTELVLLANRMAEVCSEIAKQFDERNNSTFYSDRLGNIDELLGLANKEFPL